MNNQIIELLKSYNIIGEVVGIYNSPSFITYKIKIKNNININKLLKLENDFKFYLGVQQLTIKQSTEAKSIDFEIPKEKKEIVNFQDITQLKKENNKIILPLGINKQNQLTFFDLTKTPHLLIAGSTGAGKSVFINSIINSIILNYTTEEIRLLLIDCKQVEFSIYENTPHLLSNVITTQDETIEKLDYLIDEMMKRYNLFKNNGVKNIEEYNNKQKNKLPFVVCIIDELADLMSTHKKEIEQKITRLTQLSRASGIHLIIATQRPSADILTGVIKNNIPERIAFFVPSAIDSRTILSQKGAEKLNGKGDFLRLKNGALMPERLQGLYITTEEIQKNVKTAINTQSINNNFTLKTEEKRIISNYDKKIIDYIKQNQNATIEKIQLLFKVDKLKIEQLKREVIKIW